MATPVNASNFGSEVLNYSGPVIVDFAGTHCGPCSAFAPTFSSLESELSGKAKFCKFEFDNSNQSGWDTVSPYGVTSVPTVSMYQNGSVVNQQVLPSADDIRSWVGGSGGGAPAQKSYVALPIQSNSSPYQPSTPTYAASNPSSPSITSNGNSGTDIQSILNSVTAVVGTIIAAKGSGGGGHHSKASKRRPVSKSFSNGISPDTTKYLMIGGGIFLVGLVAIMIARK